MQDLVLLSKDDLKTAFLEWASQVKPKEDETYLTSAELASHLGYSLEWVHQATSKVKRGYDIDFPPFYRRGRRLLWIKSEVDAWMQSKDSNF